ncbi:MAG: hypothetical protein K0Q89_28 [Thermomicrobiales bacterium]|nr:hypothetical protein [Thermomicrobiales bacterium]
MWVVNETIWDDEITEGQVWVGLDPDHLDVLFLSSLPDEGAGKLSKRKVKDLRNALNRALTRMVD